MTFVVRPLCALSRFLDVLMIPLMWIAAGTFRESPQRTHFWNNTKVPIEKAQRRLRKRLATHIRGSEEECVRWFFGIPAFHIPLLGGWRRYVVLAPEDSTVTVWHVGWLTPNRAGFSRIPITGPVRMLRGQHNTWFFGLNEHGKQIRITSLGTGTIGDGGKFKNLPLL